MRTPKRHKDKLPSNSHRRAPNQEKELASRLGGRTVRGSGSGAEKGDVRIHKVLRIEAKTTKNKSFSVTREMLVKIEDAAVSSCELPALVIEFVDDQGKPLKEVAVVPTYVLDAIVKHDPEDHS